MRSGKKFKLTKGERMTFQERPIVFEPGSLGTIGLTQREREVLAWVAEGKSNKDVGIILGIHAVTVKKHLEHIFKKMGVETRTAAVVAALKLTRQIVQTTSFLPFVCDLFDELLIASLF
jgi:DNA-binding CsgD family transcriptional regulator